MLSTDAIDVIINRRSIRAFDPKAVEREILEGICRAALYSCNGCGQQRARMLLVTNGAVLDSLREIVADRFHRMSIARCPSRERTIRKAQANQSFDFTYGAPALAVAVAPADWLHSMADCACMLQNLQNAAWYHGLGACWVNQLRWLCEDGDEDFLPLLHRIGMQADEAVFGSVSIGYFTGPAPKPAPRREGRLVFID